MTKEQQELYDVWSKEDIYEAYLLEHKARKLLEMQTSRLEEQLADTRDDNTIRFYDGVEGWMECGIAHNKVYISSHCYDDGKFSKPMFRLFMQFMELFIEVRAELKYNYLVDFFKKHYEVENLIDTVYIIRKK